MARRVLRVNWGPQHPITGPFRFILDIDGDRIVSAEPSIGYTHRGIEKLAENRNYLQIVPLVERLCTADAFHLDLGYSMIVEELMGIEPPERAQFIRTIMCELNRIMSHFYWLSLFTIAAGLPTVLFWAIADREILIDLAEIVTGSRVTYSYIVPGGVTRDLPEEFFQRIHPSLDYIEKRLDDYERIVYENRVYKMRCINVGVLKPQDAIALGAAGPSLRGSGIKNDIRKDEPYAAYDQIDFEIAVEEGCDAYARAKVRLKEMRESLSIIRQAVAKLPGGPVRVKMPMTAPEGEAYARVEAARGEESFYLVSKGGDKPYRLKITTPSFRNAYVVPYLLKDVKIADVPIILLSFDIWPLDLDK